MFYMLINSEYAFKRRRCDDQKKTSPCQCESDSPTEGYHTNFRIVDQWEVLLIKVDQLQYLAECTHFV